MQSDKSIKLYQKALELIPGGVNSPVRAGRSVNADPLFISCGSGSHIYDVDDNGYIDYVCSWGPLILGHARPEVVAAVKAAAEQGLSFGAPAAAEIELAEQVTAAFPSIEMVRMVSSGTEAAMSAVRLARGYTGRDIIVKFDGCYHGHGDALLVAPGSGLATLSLSGSAGVPQAVVQSTVSLPYNDLDAVTAFMQRRGRETACIIVEPVAGNMGFVAPNDGFLQGLRQLCDHYGALLVFDEVITGFRLAKGGAQERFGVKADLTVLGKILGGGMPVGAYGGGREIMECLAPLGPVYQAGTLSGNPVAMACGTATLGLLTPEVYAFLEDLTERLVRGLKDAADVAGIPVQAGRSGSMAGLFFSSVPVHDYQSAQKADTGMFAIFYRAMREKGVYLAPSQFEVMFVSAAHTPADIDKTLKAAEYAFHACKHKLY